MLRFVIGIVFGVLLIFFVTQNTAPAQITFLFWTITLSRSLMFLIVFGLGFGIGWISRSSRRKRRIKKEG
jgi:uncharacterized integral membrane protein